MTHAKCRGEPGIAQALDTPSAQQRSMSSLSRALLHESSSRRSYSNRI
jgi:hypothetical protein